MTEAGGKVTGLARRRRAVALPCLAVALALSMGGCTEWLRTPLSALDPAGPGAAPVARLWWVMFWGSLAITAFMVALGLYVGLRNAGDARLVPSRLLVIGGGVIFPTVVVTALLVYGIPTGQALFAVADDPRAFHVHIRTHQWWWEVRYPDAGDGASVHDANELHIPVGRPVHVHLTTNDVIHAFWVPRLGGKIDAIPGVTNVIRIKADRPGGYRGQCAEFCGDQHARMAFIAQAHEEEALARELTRLASRSRDIASETGAGADAFRAECARCHSIDSRTPAVTVGPNLAGLAERKFLAAGWIANEPGAVRTWIREHQAIKPRNRMPSMAHLSDETVNAIVAFLEQRR
jgi:cytochrome c oxidase subunit II